MEEKLYEFGVLPMPDKPPTDDQLALEAIEDAENGAVHARATRAQKARVVDSDVAESREAFRRAVAKGTVPATSSSSTSSSSSSSQMRSEGVNTHGTHVGAATESHAGDKAEGDESDRDSVFGSDDDADVGGELSLEAMRAKRLQELRAQTQALSNMKLSLVKEIEPLAFEEEAKEASKRMVVVMLLYLDSSLACQMMLKILETLAKQFPATKFIKMKASSHIRNFPPEHSPTIIVYREGVPLKQFVTLAAFHGAKTTASDVEWALARIGAVKSELTEDPRESAMFEKR